MDIQQIKGKIDSIKSELNILESQLNEKKQGKSNEKLLSEEENRFVIFPIKEDEIWKQYKMDCPTFIILLHQEWVIGD